MGFIQHEESRRLRRFMFWSIFGFVIGAHLIRALTYSSPTPGGPGLNEFFGRAFWGNFQNYLIHPLNDLRLIIGDGVGKVARVCPDSAASGCEKAVGVLRLILGLQP